MNAWLEQGNGPVNAGYYVQRRKGQLQLVKLRRGTDASTERRVYNIERRHALEEQFGRPARPGYFLRVQGGVIKEFINNNGKTGRIPKTPARIQFEKGLRLIALGQKIVDEARKLDSSLVADDVNIDSDFRALIDSMNPEFFDFVDDWAEVYFFR